MKTRKLKVVLLGKGDLAIKIANWFYRNDKFDLVCIVPVVPEPTWTNSLINWAKENHVSYVPTGHYKDIGIDENKVEIDLAISVTYDKIIKEWFIKKCARIINIHNGPLPKYRGVSPINWALKNNEPVHGVTIHEITPGIDDGPIISQVTFSIFPDIDEVVHVYKRCLDFGWELFIQTIPLIDKIKPFAQNDSLSTYYDLSQNKFLKERSDFTRRKSAKVKH